MGITLSKIDLKHESIYNSIKNRNIEQIKFINYLKNLMDDDKDENFINDANVLINNYHKKQKKLDDELLLWNKINKNGNNNYDDLYTTIEKYLNIDEMERKSFKIKYMLN